MKLLHNVRRRRGPIALALVALAASLLVIGAARPAEATDPFIAGQPVTRTIEIPATAADAAVRRATQTAARLRLPAAPRTIVERIEDRRAGESYDEVTELDTLGRPSAVLRYTPEGRLTAAARLGWTPGAGTPLQAPADAIRTARDIAGGAGLVPAGTPSVPSHGANGWTVTWVRSVDGVPVPGDGLRMRLWPDGSFHDLADSEHPLAPAPASRLPASVATATAVRLLDRWIPAAFRSEAAITSIALAWVAPNDTFGGGLTVGASPARRLAWVVSVRTSGTLAETLGGLEAWLDAGDGSLLGGDVLR